MANPYDSVQARLAALHHIIDSRLAELAPAGPPSEGFNKAIRYSLLAPGKRLRPIITLLTATSLGAAERDALDPACAIEMIHTASLIIDDLPAMDNAEYRRGRPTNHAVFGEDKTILAGFALVNQAFDVIARTETLSAETRLALIKVASNAIGMNGIIAGQELDLRGDEQEPSLDSVQRAHTLKTGALFVAAAEAGARIAGLTGSNLKAIRSFGHYLGLAYQTRDDLIDRFRSRDEAGKDVGADEHKATLVRILGTQDAQSLSLHFMESAIRSLEAYGKATDDLAAMTRMIFGDGMTIAH